MNTAQIQKKRAGDTIARVVHLNTALAYRPTPQIIDECLSKIEYEWIDTDAEYLAWTLFDEDRNVIVGGILIGHNDNEDILGRGYQSFVYGECDEAFRDGRDKEAFADEFHNILWDDNKNNDHDIKRYLYEVIKRSPIDIEYKQLKYMIESVTTE